KALSGFHPRTDAFDIMATTYAETFRGFEFRKAYRLRSTGNQVRYFVHLTHSPLAVTAFESAFKATQNIGLFHGRALDFAERAKLAASYRELFAGTTTTLDQLYESGGLPLSRGQIK